MSSSSEVAKCNKLFCVLTGKQYNTIQTWMVYSLTWQQEKHFLDPINLNSENTELLQTYIMRVTNCAGHHALLQTIPLRSLDPKGISVKMNRPLIKMSLHLFKHYVLTISRCICDDNMGFKFCAMKQTILSLKELAISIWLKRYILLCAFVLSAVRFSSAALLSQETWWRKIDLFFAVAISCSLSVFLAPSFHPFF